MNIPLAKRKTDLIHALEIAILVKWSYHPLITNYTSCTPTGRVVCLYNTEHSDSRISQYLIEGFGGGNIPAHC